MKNLDTLLKSSRPDIEPRQGSTNLIMHEIHNLPVPKSKFKFHFNFATAATACLASILTAGAALAYFDASVHPDGLSGRLAHRIGLSGGVKEMPETALPAQIQAIDLPDCSSGQTLCKVAVQNGEVLAIPAIMLTKNDEMDRLGRSLSAQSQSNHSGAKIMLYSDPAAAKLYAKANGNLASLAQSQSDFAQSRYVGQFVRMGIGGHSPGGAYLSYIPKPGMAAKTIQYEASLPNIDSNHGSKLAVSGLTYLGGEIIAIDSKSLSLKGKTNEKLVYDASTKFVMSGNIQTSRGKLQVGDIIYVLATDDGTVKRALEVVMDAGVKNTSGGIEYDFYGVDLKAAETAFITHKK